MAYYEEPIATDFKAFKDVVQSRRSIRRFLPEPIPDSLVEEILDLGMLAPNSSNLQPWVFYWVKNEQKRKALAGATLNQNAAKTAPVLIVVGVRPSIWRAHAKKLLKVLEERGLSTPIAENYYKKIAPMMYMQGPFGILGFVKKIVFGVIGIFRPVPRFPFGKSKLEVWAQKSTALACENIMLGFRAAGYDSCPMEGYDEKRVKKILNIPRDVNLTMIIGAGKRAPDGLYGPRVRFPREDFVTII